ncbi:MAG TPA: DUF6600 domain-containing protein [Methylomirabilota bacterium]|jgi:hypothetical protein|nr:DUF6600 domain-containing protein [Methylomirabilota bacterium]
MQSRWLIGLTLAFGVLTGGAPATLAADLPGPEQLVVDRTPPRLGFVDGQVSFWRPGAQDWAQAQVNTPLAPGDQLSTGSPGNLEVQIGARAFVRAWANTQLGLANQEPDFLQFTVTGGHASFDLRALEPGTTVEVDTPNAAFTIEQPGYYRVDVTGERTSFITRRGGRATVTPANGAAVALTPSEAVVVEGTAQLAAFAAPPLDDWDRWNYARTDRLLEAVSTRYVSPGTYGVTDLDPYGTWRTLPTYGPVWVPTGMPPGWVPYSTGAWVLDPTYGWTWVDAAPWGWAPYHYGRWVFVDGFWAWAPGPLLVRPVYAPALVAFFGPGAGIDVGIGGPIVCWVALGWGEPVVPWWGPRGFSHVPSWRGWGGPRIVNNVVINNTTVWNVQDITVYRNVSAPNALVAVRENRFGRGPITTARVARVDGQRLKPIHAAPRIAATPASFVPTARPGIRPSDDTLKRAVVATRPPRLGSESASGETPKIGPAGTSTTPPRLVSVPRPHGPALAPPRSPLGPSVEQRPMPDRARESSPPRLERPWRPEPSAGGASSAIRPAPAEPRRESPVAGPSPLAAPPVRRGGVPPVAGPLPAVPPGHRVESPPLAGPSLSLPPPARRDGVPPIAGPSAAAPPLPDRRGSMPPVARPSMGAPPSRRDGSEIAGPPPTVPLPPIRRGEAPPGGGPSPAAPPGLTRRADVPPPAAPPQPGDPANRAAPNRARGGHPQPEKPGD